MLKNDRGTVLVARLFSGSNPEPTILNIQKEDLAGLALNGTRIREAFSEGAINGPKSAFSASLALIRNNGTVSSPPKELPANPTRIELLIVYPDGTTKLSTREPKTGETLIWDDSLACRVRGLDPDDWWKDDWRKNPAMVRIVDGVLVGRECDSGTTDPC